VPSGCSGFPPPIDRATVASADMHHAVCRKIQHEYMAAVVPPVPRANLDSSEHGGTLAAVGTRIPNVFIRSPRWHGCILQSEEQAGRGTECPGRGTVPMPAMHLRRRRTTRTALSALRLRFAGLAVIAVLHHRNKLLNSALPGLRASPQPHVLTQSKRLMESVFLQRRFWQ
jgi:hypothetical protein